MRVKTYSVMHWLFFITFAVGTVSLILLPKLAGPLSGVGNFVHEIRMDLLAAEEFRHPPHRLEPEKIQDAPFPYQQYRACNECLIPMYIGTVRNGWKGRDTVIRIMNIRPKYQYGMKLPAGDYNVEIQLDPSKRSSISKHALTLTPDNNVFIFKPIGDREVIRVNH